MYLHAVTQISMTEPYYTFSSHTLSPIASFPASFEFSFPIHCTRTRTEDILFFFFTLVSTFILFHYICRRQYFFVSSFSFLVSRFFDNAYTSLFLCCKFLTRHRCAMLSLIHDHLFFPLFNYYLLIIVLSRKRARTRASHVAFSAFLSTENDLHHNLRPNIGGHTSRHNNRVPSEILNGQGGCFAKKERVWDGRTREKLEIENC